jgi:hypothetical protein
MASFAHMAGVSTIDTEFGSPTREDLIDEDRFEFEEGADGSRSTRNLTASSFVRKLYDMVHGENTDIIGWLADGLSFEVINNKKKLFDCLYHYFMK